MALSTNPTACLSSFRPPHAREPWDLPFCAKALIHTKLSILRGTEDGGSKRPKDISRLYEAAKTRADYTAATQLIDIIWNKRVEEELANLVIQLGVRPIIAFPHPGFDDDDAIDHDAGSRIHSRNAIPFAHAARLRIALQGFENTSVKQAARVGRTKLGRFPRFLFQPSFTGAIEKDRPYVLVDDTLTLGGTLAVMRSYIVHHGGTVVAVSALAHSLGRDIEFAQTEVTNKSLLRMYGSELVDFWMKEIGHEPIRLTNAEAEFLKDWAADKLRSGREPHDLLHELRARLDRARATCR